MAHGSQAPDVASLLRILDGIGDWLFALDRDWRFVYVNEGAARALHGEREELLGRVLWDHLAEVVGTPIERSLRAAMADGRRAQLEAVEPTTRRWFYVTVQPSPGGLLVYASDVHDRRVADDARRRAELERDRLLAEARRSRAELEAMLAAMTDAVIFADPERRIVFANPAFTSTFGYALDECRGRTPRMLWADPAAYDEQALLRFHPFAGDRGPSELEYRRRDGSRFWAESVSVKVVDAAGRHLGYLGIHRDVSERRAADEALREADRRKDEFLASLSHELRNPLTPIRNSVYLLEHSADDPARVAAARSTIERQVSHLARLVDDLLDVSRIMRGKIQLKCSSVDLAELARHAAEDQRPAFAEAGVELEVDAPGPAWVEADPARIAQILGNVLHNAMKFTPPGGHVRLVLDRSAGTAVVRVIDDGVGIPSDVLPKLFQPFVQAEQTLDRSKGGLGLGLALARSLALLHGGIVWATSPGPGCGTEVVVRLPLEAAPRVEPAPAAAEVERRSLKVLVVEDNDDAADTLADLLELMGHEVQTAREPLAGIAVARATRPDVVLCDIGLPGLSGYDVARELRRDGSLDGTVLVALTGYALPDDVARAHEAGFDAHLAKPPAVSAIEDLLRRVSARDPVAPARRERPAADLA